MCGFLSSRTDEINEGEKEEEESGFYWKEERNEEISVQSLRAINELRLSTKTKKTFSRWNLKHIILHLITLPTHTKNTKLPKRYRLNITWRSLQDPRCEP
jgi:hypothetical protein